MTEWSDARTEALREVLLDYEGAAWREDAEAAARLAVMMAPDLLAAYEAGQAEVKRLEGLARFRRNALESLYSRAVHAADQTTKDAILLIFEREKAYDPDRARQLLAGDAS